MLRQTNRNYVAGMIGLLHDYHEYALGDINTPLKRFMMELGFDFNAKVADPIDRWVFGLHGITVEAYPLLHKLMHEVDSKIGTMEGLALVKGYQAPEGFSADFPFTPSHQSPEYVERQFVALYHSLNANLPRAR